MRANTRLLLKISKRNSFLGLPAIALIIVTLLSFSTANSEAIQFGNLAVFIDEDALINSSSFKITLDDGNAVGFENSGELVLWQISPGIHSITITDSEAPDHSAFSQEINILPNLTTRLFLTKTNGSMVLINDGYADQTGLLVTFDKTEISSFAGELDNGPGLFSSEIETSNVPNRIDSRLLNNQYSYDGLTLSRVMSDYNSRPANSHVAALALVNLGDPFAGDPGSDIGFISSIKQKTESTYKYQTASYGTQMHEGYSNLLLPDNIGRFVLGIAYDKHDDAFPRYNVKSILPENGLKNLELTAGSSLRLFDLFDTDTRFIYKKIKRDYYEHSYYFNLEHSPREELEFYTGTLSAYGWINQKTFLKTSLGLKGEESKFGDGKLFDDLRAYQRSYPDPGDNIYFLFWDDSSLAAINSGDTIFAEHYNSYFERFHSRSWNFTAQAQRIVNPTTGVSFQLDWNSTKIRSYQNLRTTAASNSPAEINSIGFDKWADEMVDGDNYGEIPNPTTLNMSLSFRKLFRNGGIRASVNRMSFDPGYMMIRNVSSPFGGDGTLDPADLKSAETKTKVGFRTGANLSLNRSAKLFVNYSSTYSIPTQDKLFADYNFSYYTIINGSSYPLSLPDLELINTKQYVVGVSFNLLNSDLSLALQSKNESNLPGLGLELPTFYARYMSGAEISTENLIVLVELNKNWTLTGKLLAVLNRTARPYNANQVIWNNGSQLLARQTDYNPSHKITGLIRFQPKYLSDSFIGILKRTSMALSFIHKSGNRYTQTRAYESVTVRDVSAMPTEEVDDSKVRDFFELNFSFSADVYTRDKMSISLGFEVLNLTDRENWLRVYSATGLPDDDDYLNTTRGINSTPAHKEQYLLKLNDPNNYGSPRTFRSALVLSF